MTDLKEFHDWLKEKGVSSFAGKSGLSTWYEKFLIDKRKTHGAGIGSDLSS